MEKEAHGEYRTISGCLISDLIIETTTKPFKPEVNAIQE